MKTIGIWMIVFGALGFLLPRFGYDLKWFEYLGEQRQLVQGALLVVGVVLVVLGRRKKAARG
ncbi:MAG: hypothetical protein EXS08_08815 [Planctomycetes bacterium]|nr:hypothetical protein [Planctomycetota bacterium]